jgi:hypothetical protein
MNNNENGQAITQQIQNLVNEKRKNPDDYIFLREIFKVLLIEQQIITPNTLDQNLFQPAFADLQKNYLLNSNYDPIIGEVIFILENLTELHREQKTSQLTFNYLLSLFELESEIG